MRPDPIIMTLMVRDEADIIAAMLEHHLAQGIDRIIVTDNASVDGTREILAEYEAAGAIELHDDPRHEKQQSEVVTHMARRAYEEYGAAWVINADADEFWVADSGRTVAEALRGLGDDVVSFTAPVRNMFGTPLAAGSAVKGHVWRDERDLAELNAVGLHDHPTADCVHRGAADVEVAQGNHFTNLPLTPATEIPATSRLTVLHYPYRTWNQYRHRVELTAEGYRNSDKTPSPRHHVMRDATWLEAGDLLPFHVARHPDLEAESAPAGFALDTRVRDAVAALADDGALRPDRLAEALAEPVALEHVAEARDRFATIGSYVVEAAAARADEKYQQHEFFVQLGAREAADEALTATRAELERVAAERDSLAARLRNANATIDDLNAYVARFSSHPVTKAAMLAFTPARGQRRHTLGRIRDLALAPVRRVKGMLRKGR
jgi:predicted transcriptional regulator